MRKLAMGAVLAFGLAVTPLGAVPAHATTVAHRPPVTLQEALETATTPFALCDYDGPCLNLTENTDGSAVTMFTFGSTDEFESLYFDHVNPYGCEIVTSTCPFRDTSIDAAFRGYPVLALGWSTFGSCAAAYPGVNITFNSCTTDRSVFVVAGTALISPYWTNHYSQAYALYGPPLGNQAYVNSYTNTTREEWTVRDQ